MDEPGVEKVLLLHTVPEQSRLGLSPDFGAEEAKTSAVL